MVILFLVFWLSTIIWGIASLYLILKTIQSNSNKKSLTILTSSFIAAPVFLLFVANPWYLKYSEERGKIRIESEQANAQKVFNQLCKSIPEPILINDPKEARRILIQVREDFSNSTYNLRNAMTGILPDFKCLNDHCKDALIEYNTNSSDETHSKYTLQIGKHNRILDPWILEYNLQIIDKQGNAVAEVKIVQKNEASGGERYCKPLREQIKNLLELTFQMPFPENRSATNTWVAR